MCAHFILCEELGGKIVTDDTVVVALRLACVLKGIFTTFISKISDALINASLVPF